ncbi:MAG: glycosyltransferase [candidate division Zixibacteria bacterium]|nr:glycosyltransferase [candidate division Zixibacteria bacterium]
MPKAKISELKKAGTDAEAGYVSVVIPCREEQNYIGKALRAVLANDWPSDRLEVLVVEGDSHDGTRDIVAEIAARDARIKIIDNPGLFAGSAMRIGHAAARGDYIVRVDAHAEIPPDYVKKGVAILRQHPEIWAVGGPVDRVAAGEGSLLVAAIISNIFSTGNTPVRVGKREGPIDAVACPVWRREILARVGNFDDALARNEDDDYFYRIRRAGGIVYQAQDMRAKYYVRSSIRGLLKQYNQYGFWKAVVAKKHGRFLAWKPLVPSAFFGVLALAAAAGFVTPYIWLAGGALAAAYVGADVVASIFVGIKKGFGSFLKAFVVFPALHLTYAAGITSGLWCCYVRRFSREEIRRRRLFAGLTR